MPVANDLCYGISFENQKGPKLYTATNIHAYIRTHIHAYIIHMYNITRKFFKLTVYTSNKDKNIL